MATALRNRTTGVLVSVDDATAERLGAEWERVDAAKPKRAPAKAKAAKDAPTKDAPTKDAPAGDQPDEVSDDSGTTATD